MSDITKGTWEIGHSDGGGDKIVMVRHEKLGETTYIAKVRWGCSCCEDLSDLTEQEKANLTLIAEAGTVHNETGLSPRELLEQKTDLLNLLKDILDWDGILPHSKKRIKQVIAATE